MRKYGVFLCALLFNGWVSPVIAEAVAFRFTDTIARSVSVIGSFNQFDPAANPMQRGAYGAWTNHISLPAGTHTYAFLVDGTYRVRDRYAPHHELDEDHQVVSVIRIAPETDSSVTPARTAPAASDPAEITASKISEFRETSAPQPRIPITGTVITGEFLQRMADQVTILEAAGVGDPMAVELVRQYFLIVLNDLTGLQVLDDALTSSVDRPVRAQESWRVAEESRDGTTCLRIRVSPDIALSAPSHPETEAGSMAWIESTRAWIRHVMPFNPHEKVGQRKSNIAWREFSARDNQLTLRPDSLDMWSKIFWINDVTRWARSNGYTRELCREVAVTYADLVNDLHELSSPFVTVAAARSLVYADLAHVEGEPDPCLAYVLGRLCWRGADAVYRHQNTTPGLGMLADALQGNGIGKLTRILGTPDHFGAPEAPGMASVTPRPIGISPPDRDRAMRLLGFLSFRDRRPAAASYYLYDYLTRHPLDLIVLVKLRRSLGVAGGHAFSPLLLSQIGSPSLWRFVVEGIEPDPAAFELEERGLRDISRLARRYDRDKLDRTLEAIPPGVRFDLLVQTMVMASLDYNEFLEVLYSPETQANLVRELEPWHEFAPVLSAMESGHALQQERAAANARLRDIRGPHMSKDVATAETDPDAGQEYAEVDSVAALLDGVRLEDPDDTKRRMSRAIEVAPYEHQPYHILASLYLNRGEFDNLEEIGERYFTVDEYSLNAVAIMNQIVEGYLWQRNGAGALRIAHLAGESHERKALSLLALSYELSGELQTSRIWWEAEKERYDGGGDAFLSVRQDPDEARKQMLSYLTGLEEEGDIVEAVQRGRRSVEDLHRAAFYEQILGRHDRALKHWQTLRTTFHDARIPALMEYAVHCRMAEPEKAEEALARMRSDQNYRDLCGLLSGEEDYERSRRKMKGTWLEIFALYLMSEKHRMEGEIDLSINQLRQTVDPRNFGRVEVFSLCWDALRREGIDPFPMGRPASAGLLLSSADSPSSP
jgi:tetratricopeptide (TPR) repeat protein